MPQFVPSKCRTSAPLSDISEATLILSGSSFPFTGRETGPKTTVVLSGNTLKYGSDYVTYYENSIYPGTATVRVVGVGAYVGEKTATYTIGKNIGFATVVLPYASVGYNGGAIIPTGVKIVSFDGRTLQSGIDYILRYVDNVNVGTAAVIADGTGEFAGSTAKSFSIAASDISTCGFTRSPTSHVANGTNPSVSVTVYSTRGLPLVSGTDYDIFVPDMTEVGTYSIIVTGKGNYTGTLAIPFQTTATAPTVEDPNRFYGIAVTGTTTIVSTFTGSAEEGDLYINTDTWNIYICTEGGTGSEVEWEIYEVHDEGTDITGTGEDGDPIVSVYEGVAEEGDVYVNTETGDVYICTEGGSGSGIVWGYWFSLQDDAGEHGAIVDFTGTAAVTVTPYVNEHTGNPVEPSVVVKVWGKTLTSGVDYTVAYSDNVDIGNGNVTITGRGNYTGQASASFCIGAYDVQNTYITVHASVDETTKTVTYTSTVTSTSGGGGGGGGGGVGSTPQYIAPEDSIFTYVPVTDSDGNIIAVDVYLTSTGEYLGRIPVTKSIDDGASSSGGRRGGSSGGAEGGASTSVTVTSKTHTYTKRAIVPEVEVRMPDGTILTEGKDYSLTCESNVNAGTGYVTVTGIEPGFTGSVTKSFSIGKATISPSDYVVTIIGGSVFIYDGQPKTIQFELRDMDGDLLVSGTDYAVTYINNTEVGSATCKITGVGNYQGEMSVQFDIVLPDVKDSEVTLPPGPYIRTTGSYTMSGYSVRSGNVTLVENIDYIVSYQNNDRVGSAKITFMGVGNYTGEKSFSFDIVGETSMCSWDNLDLSTSPTSSDEWSLKNIPVPSGFDHIYNDYSSPIPLANGDILVGASFLYTLSGSGSCAPVKAIYTFSSGTGGYEFDPAYYSTEVKSIAYFGVNADTEITEYGGRRLLRPGELHPGGFCICTDGVHAYSLTREKVGSEYHEFLSSILMTTPFDLNTSSCASSIDITARFGYASGSVSSLGERNRTVLRASDTGRTVLIIPPPYNGASLSLQASIITFSSLFDVSSASAIRSYSGLDLPYNDRFYLARFVSPDGTREVGLRNYGGGSFRTFARTLSFDMSIDDKVDDSLSRTTTSSKLSEKMDRANYAAISPSGRTVIGFDTSNQRGMTVNRLCGLSSEAVDISSCVVTVLDEYYLYSGSPVAPRLEVRTQSGYLLYGGHDYSVTLSGNSAIGTGYATVVGRGAWYGSCTAVQFVIKGDLSQSSIVMATNPFVRRVADESPIPQFIVRLNNATLTSGTDYEVSSVSGGGLVGRNRTFTIIGKGDYVGTKTSSSYRIYAVTASNMYFKALRQYYSGSTYKVQLYKHISMAVGSVSPSTTSQGYYYPILPRKTGLSSLGISFFRNLKTPSAATFMFTSVNPVESGGYVTEESVRIYKFVRKYSTYGVCVDMSVSPSLLCTATFGTSTQYGQLVNGSFNFIGTPGSVSHVRQAIGLFKRPSGGTDKYYLSRLTLRYDLMIDQITSHTDTEVGPESGIDWQNVRDLMIETNGKYAVFTEWTGSGIRSSDVKTKVHTVPLGTAHDFSTLDFSNKVTYIEDGWTRFQFTFGGEYAIGLTVSLSGSSTFSRLVSLSLGSEFDLSSVTETRRCESFSSSWTEAISTDFGVFSSSTGGAFAGSVIYYASVDSSGNLGMTEIPLLTDIDAEVSTPISNCHVFVDGARYEGGMTYVYTGAPITPDIKVWVTSGAGRWLMPEYDYGFEFVNNVDVGTASVVVTGHGIFYGTKTVNFAITEAI